MPPNRTVYQQDALVWLQNSPELSGCSVITSLPDLSEFRGFTLPQWKTWFQNAAELVLSRVPREGVAIFYQSDIFHQGEWVDKGYLCAKAAQSQGVPMRWHKVVCRVPAGKERPGRAGYSHLLCFSRGVVPDPAQTTADVLPHAGKVTWTRGMGMQSCLEACHFVLTQTTTRTIVDPFCGHGTVLAVANSLGMDAIGIELVAKRARRARSLSTARWQAKKSPRGSHREGSFKPTGVLSSENL